MQEGVFHTQVKIIDIKGFWIATKAFRIKLNAQALNLKMVCSTLPDNTVTYDDYVLYLRCKYYQILLTFKPFCGHTVWYAGVDNVAR